MEYLAHLNYAQEISVPSVEWSLETDFMFGVERYVPRMDGEVLDLEIRQITKCTRDPFGRRVLREQTRWTLVTCNGKHIGESFPTLEEAQEAAQSALVDLWIAKAESSFFSVSIN